MDANVNETQKRNDLINTVSMPGTLKNVSVTTVVTMKASLATGVLGKPELRGVRLTVEPGSTIRVTDDGTTATTTVGEIRPPGIYFITRGETKDFQMVSKKTNLDPLADQPTVHRIGIVPHVDRGVAAHFDPFPAKVFQTPRGKPTHHVQLLLQFAGP